MKSLTTLSATLGAALLLAGAPGLASAQDSQAPVRIDNVQLVSQSISEHQFTPISAEVSFTNEGPSPATAVEFALESDSGFVLDSFNDVGTFTPGVTIRHSFPDNDSADAGQRVAVAKVTFANGTVWTNPELVQESAQSDPSSVAVASYSLDY